MILPPERIGPYLRALRAGLEALAPHGDYVPLAEALAHLEALDPAMSGSLLLPAEINPDAGLPVLAWLERARGELALARAGCDSGDPSVDEVERALALDEALGERLGARRRLHRFLRRHDLLPGSRLRAVLKRLDAKPCFEVVYDHAAARGGWERLRLEIEGPRPWKEGGALQAGARHQQVEVHEGLRHLLARHASTSLMALHHQLVGALGGSVVRLARSQIGPFWFPGIALPAGVPPSLSDGLVLQLSSEVVGRDVRLNRHLDPWRPPPPGELVPRGSRVYRERRFCASPSLLGALVAWGRGGGIDVLAVPLVPRPAHRRTL